MTAIAPADASRPGRLTAARRDSTGVDAQSAFGLCRAIAVVAALVSLLTLRAVAMEDPVDHARRARLAKTRAEVIKIVESFGDTDTVAVRVAEGHVLVTGRVRTSRRRERLRQALSNFSHVIVHVEAPSPAEEVAQDLRLPLPLGVQARPSGQVVLLVGVVAAQDRPRVKRIASQKFRVGEQEIQVVDLTQDDKVQQRPRVEVSFHFVELSKSDRDHLGVEWSEQLQFNLSGALNYAAPFGGGGGGGGLFTGSANVELTATLRALHRKGTVRVHDGYSTTVDSARTAVYRREGIVYVPVSGLESGDLKEVPFGVNVEVTPTVRQARKIETVVTARISQLAESSSDRLTVFQEHVATQLTLAPKQVVMLWRAVQRSDEDTARAVPGLAKVPAVGRLFQSSSFRSGKTESALFIETRLRAQETLFDTIMTKLKKWPSE